MKSDFHVHSKWCDGRGTLREMAAAAAGKGLSVLGFSSHSMLPSDDESWVLTSSKIAPYEREVREVAEEFKGVLSVCLGVEADYISGVSSCDRSVYESISPDYIIGSVHYVALAGGELACVDKSPQDFAESVSRFFGGDAKAFVKAYFESEREMLRKCDFDIAGHVDLVRKFNSGGRFFNESDGWYKGEVEATADAIARSGRIVEVNTGGICRGWIDDAYPSEFFRSLLRSRGVRFILSSDAHSADGIGFQFDRFSGAEDYIRPQELPFASRLFRFS